MRILFTLISVFVWPIIGYTQSSSKFVIKDLLNSSWELIYFRDSYTNNIEKYSLQKKVIITFDDSLPIISLSGVCNNGSGRYYYDLKSDSIRIEIAITLMNCPEIDLDDRVRKGLSYAYKCKISGEEMTIYSNSDYLLCFKEYKKKITEEVN